MEEQSKVLFALMGNNPTKYLYEIYVKINQVVQRETKSQIENLFVSQKEKIEKRQDLNEEKRAFHITALEAARKKLIDKKKKDDNPAKLPKEEVEETELTRLTEEYEVILKSIKSETKMAGRAYFNRMEKGDKECFLEWKMFKYLTILELKIVYSRMNITFDVYSGESEVQDTDELLEELMKSHNCAIESDNSVLYDLTDENLGKALIRKSDGSTLYITRDIKSCIDRHKKYNADILIYVVGSSQEYHFKQFFTLLKLEGA